MEEPNLCFLEPFWQKLQQTQQGILLLDYDGTLAPFQRKRDDAIPYPGVREILKKIQDAGKTRLIIISGRNIHDIVTLLGLEELPEIWGGHGFERLKPGDDLQRKKIPAACSLNLQKAKQWATDHGFGPNCEKKGASLAFHWRGVAQSIRMELEKEVSEAWGPLAEGVELVITPFDGGIELRCTDMHKGEAVRQILAESPKGAVLAYLGDDLTDEDAFRVLKGKGLTVLVRKTHRPTLADHWLKPPEELLDFLLNWHKYIHDKK